MAQKLSEPAFAYSFAIVLALYMLLLGIFGYLGVYTGAVNAMMQWHIFFAISPFGIVAGMIEAAVFGFIFGYLIAWFYNKFA